MKVNLIFNHQINFVNSYGNSTTRCSNKPDFNLDGTKGGGAPTNTNGTQNIYTTFYYGGGAGGGAGGGGGTGVVLLIY